MWLKIFTIVFYILVACEKPNEDIILGMNDPFNEFDEEGSPRLSKSSEFLIIIPDIQLYTFYEQYQPVLRHMIDRTLEMQDKGYHIKAVLQVGDLTDRNTPREWQAAKEIFSKMDTKINYVFCTGNHDYGDEGTSNNRNTLFNDYIKYTGNTAFVATCEPEQFQNAYFQFSIHEQAFQLFSLEFGPRDTIVNWARKLADENPDRKGILLTHAYLFKDNQRYDWANFGTTQNISPYEFAMSPLFGAGNVNDGEDLWNKLIYETNIRFVFCGHKTNPDYTGKMISQNKQNEEVLQMLYNTQSLPNAGDGWFQILEFYDDRETVGIKTYSALYNTWNTESVYQYEFIY